MRTAIALILLLCGACVAIPAARAGDTVYRCIDAHGSPVFSDQPCAALSATPVQAPAATGRTQTPDGSVPLAGCAATPAALRQRVIHAFAARDPNQLAGLMVWRGYGRHAAIGDVKSLATLVRQPLIGIRLGDDDDDAAAPAASVAAAPDADDASILQVRTGGPGGRTARFAIHRQAGCLWLRFAG